MSRKPSPLGRDLIPIYPYFIFIFILYEISHLPVIGVGGAASGGCAASSGSAAAAGNAAGRRRLAGRAKPVPAFSGLKFTAVPEVHWSERDPALEQLPLSRGPKKVIGSAKMHLDVV